MHSEASSLRLTATHWLEETFRLKLRVSVDLSRLTLQMFIISNIMPLPSLGALISAIRDFENTLP